MYLLSRPRSNSFAVVLGVPPREILESCERSPLSTQETANKRASLNELEDVIEHSYKAHAKNACHYKQDLIAVNSFTFAGQEA